MIPPVAARLDDGRLHLQHGPIDLLITVQGTLGAVSHAERAAFDRFGSVLAELSPQLPLLRSDVRRTCADQLDGPIARRMHAAAALLAPTLGFVTPMAAVAGAIADEVRATIAAVQGVSLAIVNNGGDVALHLTHGRRVRVGLVADLSDGGPAHTLEVLSSDPVRGIATSGAQGRSMSLGIADAVTVLASSCAVADAAATLVANAVDLPGHPAVRRVPARELDLDSDLGELMVTTGVGLLSDAEVDEALEAGRAAVAAIAATHPEIHGAVLGLRGRTLVVGPAAPQLQAHVANAARPALHALLGGER